MKYGVKENVIGVYMIRNKKNNKKYIGSSINILGRFSNHMNRDSYRYDSEFYRDIRSSEYTDFDFIVLEECDKDELITKEQYYFDLLKPEYNQFRPEQCMFVHEEIRKKAIEKSNTKEKIKQRKAKYNTEKYQKMFRSMHSERMKPVTIKELNLKFESIRACARWLDKNTNFKSRNKATKVKAVCDGERNMAYGFTYEYTNESVETISKESTVVIDTQSEAMTK
ncbi:GIY-YIG nuclease family protein [Staphylococcus sp. GDY8P94P]|uniref:GIY-YIG nuclease family protein n=1 Tax=Staphylococcus sp. GDY8P94P TaxID=2804144 RepID=UPI001AEBDD6E|nr:GIY-YIG nuclease family protein [Staphylococcus sp. GDY8P94P]